MPGQFSLPIDRIQEETVGFELAGAITAMDINVVPAPLPEGRLRHRYGDGPFVRLRMPQLPSLPGVYLWQVDDEIAYVGQTTGTLKSRLGSNGYSTISNYNTFARQLGQKNGGQQTNCRINALANRCLRDGSQLAIWCKVTEAEEAAAEEQRWMRNHGCPPWNRRDER